MSLTPQSKNLEALRKKQLANLSGYYRANHETESAVAIDWALRRITELENDLAWWHQNGTPKDYWPAQGAGDKPAPEPRYGRRR